MKTIWTIIGVIVLIAIIVLLVRKYNQNKSMQIKLPVVASTTTPAKDLSMNTTSRTVDNIIQPIYVVQNSTDCNQAYKDNVQALFDVYRQKRVIYNNAINTNDPNVIQYHKDLNDAYNAYYDEASKCNYFFN